MKIKIRKKNVSATSDKLTTQLKKFPEAASDGENEDVAQNSGFTQRN